MNNLDYNSKVDEKIRSYYEYKEFMLKVENVETAKVALKKLINKMQKMVETAEKQAKELNDNRYCIMEALRKRAEDELAREAEESQK